MTPSGEEPIATGGWPFFEMTNKLQIRRALLLLTCLVALFGGLGYRLVDLQVVQHDKLLALAEKKTERRLSETAKRGDILDANGNLLATSIPVRTVWANPELLAIASQRLMPNAPAIFAHTLAPLLKVDEASLSRQMQLRTHVDKKGQTVTNQYAVLRRQVSEDTWRQIQDTLRNLPASVDTRSWKRTDRVVLTNICFAAIATDPDQMRVYPNGSLAAQVVGYVGTVEFTNQPTRLVGRDGIESYFDNKLAGVDGWRVTEADSARREMVSHRDEDVPARDGLNVSLTLDARVQDIVQSELATAMKEHDPVSITGIVMRPRTGEILAMAQLPTFDPNNIRKEDSNSLPNRCISDVMEPGSTFKTIVISGALNEHVFTLNDTVFCENGLLTFAGLRLHDSEGHHFGNLPVWQVLQKSSNIGAAKIGMKMQGLMLHDYMTAFGLGADTGIVLPHEARTDWYVPTLEAWNKKKYLIAQVPMGQGVAATRLQMIMALGALANNGVLMRPMLVKSLQEHSGAMYQTYSPQAVRSVVTPATAKLMVEAMKTVVSKDGTAPTAKLDNYVVAGKTGTAQKVVNGRYANDKFVVSFIGFFPADNPQICISIVMDAPKEGGHAFGGALCGPVFKNIAERCASYLNIPPDPSLMPTNSTLMAENSYRSVRNP